MAKPSLTDAEKLVRHRLQERKAALAQSLSISETARREDQLLIRSKEELEMFWAIGSRYQRADGLATRKASHLNAVLLSRQRSMLFTQRPTCREYITPLTLR